MAFLSNPEAGQSVLDWAAGITDQCRRNRVTVAANSGLTSTEGADGTALGLAIPPPVVTTEAEVAGSGISARNGLKDGTGDVYPLDDDGTGTNTMKYRLDASGNKVRVTIRNGFNQVFVAGLRVHYVVIGEMLKLSAGECPPTSMS